MAGAVRRKASNAGWQKKRAIVMARDKGVCQVKLKGTCTYKAEHVHHLLGWEATKDDLNYLVAACAACNLTVGDPGRYAEPDCGVYTRW